MWQARVEGLGANQIVLGAAAETTVRNGRPPIEPKAGKPLLLVTIVTPGVTIAAETAVEPEDGPYHRLVGSVRANAGRFRVVLTPFRFGDALPGTPELDFQTLSDGRTRTRVLRSGRSIGGM